MFVGLRPAASFPSNAGSASRKSPVDNPRRYSSGSTSATWGDRRMYGGRIRLVNRWRSPSSSTRRSFTRGARTFIVPAPQVTFRDCARPFRTTRRRPSASRAAARVSMYCSTSASRATTSMRRAPSRATSSRVGMAPSDVSRLSSLVGSSTFNIGWCLLPPGLPGPASQGGFCCSRGRIRAPVSRPRSTTSGYTSR